MILYDERRTAASSLIISNLVVVDQSMDGWIDGWIDGCVSTISKGTHVNINLTHAT
jgi:hypothetical protein